ncbi:hypothetical protein EY643_12825 [Halioglobus maricola]|uniref:Uncharacterized protein n=1 Tax=Halioglobus maricola TaxID=2601894 RepID=A0A5P9NKV1_9GAMM|nr:hypothetical protein [Halioglobus maricola]QFU76470.1 hypothetical protein EY643_12825 [Halioglobus maricola]
MWQLEEGIGSYLYLLNDEPVPVKETWSVTRLDEGALAIASERAAPGIAIRVAARVVRGQLSEFDVDWQADGANPIRARYRLDVNSGWCGCREIDGNVEDFTPLGSELVGYPLMRIFTGSVIAELAAARGAGQVLVPSIGSPQELDTLLLPDISRRAVHLLGTEDLQNPAGSITPCERWQFIGGQYTEDAAFWLNSGGRLARYTWHQSPEQRWDVWLQQGK